MHIFGIYFQTSNLVLDNVPIKTYYIMK
uniref:Uncharacterized protein n=1 Tax=Arundo donax TaxID=35708 RepID=A0A0A9BN01_ARUDO